MKPTIMLKCLIICLTVLAVSCQNPPKPFYNKEFKWTMTIPKGFERVSNQESSKDQKEGASYLKKATGKNINTRGVKQIIEIKNGPGTAFIANYQSYSLSDGNYKEYCILGDKIVYNAFKNDYPKAVIDSTLGAEKIDGLAFQKFKVTVSINNKTENMLVYRRLFGNNDFAVTITYIDPPKRERNAKELEKLNIWKIIGLCRNKEIG